MKSNIIFCIAIAILAISEGILIWKSQQQKKEILLKDNYIGRMATGANAMENAFTAHIDNAGAMLDGEAMLKDTAGNTLPLKEIAKGKKSFLICRYGQQMCPQCVDHAISVIADSMSRLDGERILFLSQNSSRRSQKVLIREHGIKDCPFYDCPGLGIPADKADYPYIMAVDSSLKVLSVYFPTKDTHGSDYDFRHVKYIWDKMIK